MKQYKTEIVGLLFAFAALNVWYLSGLAIDKAVLPKNYEWFIRTLTIVVGAFAGAYAAFWLKTNKELLEKKDSQRSSLNNALFVLVRQINAIKNIKTELDKYSSEFEKSFVLPAIKPSDYSELKFDFNSLYFLMDGNHVQMLMELDLEEERFFQCISATMLRSEFLVHELQPALSFHASQGRITSEGTLQKYLGDRLFRGAVSSANNMYMHVNESHETLCHTFFKLRSIAKKIFPNDKFIMLAEASDT